MAKPKANSPLNVMYVEVNDVNFANAGCYSLTGSTDPLFDIAIIFAANINFDTATRKATLFLNPNVTTVLQNVETYVRPLQAKGIKVLLSILGNHEGAGICNFENESAAHDFAVLLANAVRDYGLDGIDFDDEYSEYGNNNTGPPNPSSFIYLIRELRSLIPDKIISLYYYGPVTSRLSYDGMVAGDFLDYSWNSIYGTYQVPNVPGLEKNQLGPAAVNVTSTSAGTAQNLATRTKADGYGVYLMYALPNTNAQAYLSGVSTILYGKETTLAGGCLRPWPPQGQFPAVTRSRAHPQDSSRGRARR